MAWRKLYIQTTQQYADIISDLLDGLGALSVSLTDAKDEPLFEPGVGETPLWQEVMVEALFPLDVELDDVSERLSVFHQPVKVLRQEVLHEKDWQRECEQDFQPLKISEKLWIIPTWSSPVDADAVNILLDPGLAFGTGKHPTTALCLRWLSDVLQGGETVIDYGCGSGILAIAAAKLGAKAVYATDIDPQAVAALTQNAMLNGVADTVVVGLPGDGVLRPADIVIANILANPLMELAPTLAALVLPKGKIALSGILAHQAQEVRQAYAPYGPFTVCERLHEWVLLANAPK